MTYNLYFQINDKEPEFQGQFNTEKEAIYAVRKIVDEKSSVTHTDTWRFWNKDGVTYIDYGAHNARYIIEEVNI
ncbi:hypothetical protein [Streptococcus marmotae]|uniref:hypothetical protein n=1 Tax=Streptococcus marmotae TaxID=1825069 RepID=UPI00082EE0D0|nr:hypothetical protein [Streptococcus marmotae]